MQFSICTTSYQSAHALKRHLQSLFEQMSSFEFEYIVTDNKSKDGSLEILKEWESRYSNVKVLSKKCTMGEGRQISFKHSSGDFILVPDTDVIYFPLTKKFLNVYLDKYSDVAIQAVMLGVFPRTIWEEVGGRRSLNAFEDVDMWIRAWRLGKMRWCPVLMGENVKEASAVGSFDFMSRRYGKWERIVRLLRKEYDLLKTRGIRKLDLVKISQDNQVDLGLAEFYEEWFDNYPKLSPAENVKRFGRQIKSVLKD